MKSVTRRVSKIQSSRLHRESGFTLVELIIVVSIIVSIGGVIFPSVTQFMGEGEIGAAVEEFDSVQTALDLMIADTLTLVINPSPGVSKKDWSTFPNGPGITALENYLRAGTTDYFYCWDDTALITAQHEESQACPS